MPSPNLHLSRIDSPTSHGWMVRIARGEEKIIQFFGDNKFGGKRLAQAAARGFRDETLARLMKQGKLPRAKKIVTRQKRNKTGVIGISKVFKKRPNGRLAPYYTVTWHPQPGVARGTSISIEKYGEERAFKKAKALRNKQLMRRFGSGVFRKIKAIKQEKHHNPAINPNNTGLTQDRKP